jgi:hypothetical protein
VLAASGENRRDRGMERVERGRSICASIAEGGPEHIERALDLLIAALVSAVALNGGHECARCHERFTCEREQTLGVVRRHFEPCLGRRGAVPIGVSGIRRGRIREAATLDRSERRQHRLACERGIARERGLGIDQRRLPDEIDAAQEHVDLRPRNLELPHLCRNEALLELVCDRRDALVSHDARRALERMRRAHQLFERDRRVLGFQRYEAIAQLERLCPGLELEERQQRGIVEAHASACESEASTRVPSSTPTMRSPTASSALA